jgi:hypothetical protein
MSILRSVIAEFAVRVDGSPLEKLGERINGVKGALVALGAALAVDRVGAWVNEVAGAADDLGDMSDRLGISTAALQEWGYAAQLSGSSAEDFQASIGHVVRSIAEAGSGGKEMSAAFRKLGVDVKDSEGNLGSVEDMLPSIADGLAAVENETERSALAFQIFGRGAQPLIPLLSRGAAGVEELRKEFRELGGGFSDEAVEQASEYADTLDRLEVVQRSLKSTILGAVLPAFQLFADVLQRVGQGVRWVTENTKLIEAALTVAGGAVAVFAAQWIRANAAMLAASIRTWVPIVARFALAGAAVLGVVLIVESLITLFSGGKSVIGDFIDSIFGLGTAEEVVISLRQSFDELFYAAQRAAAAVGLADEPEMTPQQQQQRRRDAAVQSGDLNGFLKDRLPGMSRERAREDFLASRGALVRERPELATDVDVNSGLAKNVQAPRVSAQSAVTAPRARMNAQVDAPKIDIHLPPGAPAQQVDDTRRVVKEELDKHHRRTLAAFGGLAP